MSHETSLALKTDDRDWWTTHCGDSPILGTAIHNGHEVRGEVEEQMAIDETDRLREEDPFTEFIIRDVPNRIVFHRSRFAVDLNRAREKSVYLSPEQSWGLKVWDVEPSTEIVEQSLMMHDQYYRMLELNLKSLEERFGAFVVLDIHSYNHRRDGEDRPATDPDMAPEINIGTFSMNRRKWAHVVDPFLGALRDYDFDGRHLDVRENVAFEGRGEQTRFIHERFPETGCAIAIEFKKFFMDEWSGWPSRYHLAAMRNMINSTLPVLERAILDPA